MSIFTRILLFVSALFVFANANAQQLHTQWTITSKKISDCEYDIVFNVKIDPKWHMYSSVPSVPKTPDETVPNPTVIKIKKSSDYEKVGKLKEGKPIEQYDDVFETTVRFFENNATFTQRVKVLKAGKVEVTGTYEYEACVDVCEFPPPKKFSVILDIPATAPCVTKTALKDTVASKEVKDTAKTEIAVAPVKDSTETGISPVKETSTGGNANECSPWATLLLGLSVGFGAVLMPCVYSLIPLTVSFFLKQSKSKAAGVKNALLYGFFIIFIFVALTMIITLIAGPLGLSKIATSTPLNIFFFLLFVVFALSFFGLFEITLPSSWANKIDAKSDRGGVIGIFFMALTLVIVSFSCTVGFMGGLLTAVAKGDGYLCPLMGFTGFGTGIALPFMLFAFFPSWLKSLPKSGGWMTTFKVTIAFIELALAIKFLSNADNVNEWGLIKREVFIALWIGIFAMLTFYLLGVFRTAHDDAPGPLSIGRILWATIFMSFTIYMIPGLWGAPLKLISSFPPPHDYAESPDGVGYHNSQSAYVIQDSSAVASAGSEKQRLENLRVTGPEGLRIFKDDYANALKYAKLVNKPLFIDFTGKACVNCRLMESTVWVKPDVMKKLRDSVVIVSLYVDSNVELPKEMQEEVIFYGDKMVLETYGDKWGHMQVSKYEISGQPLYVVVNHDESTASSGPIAAETDDKKFSAWLSGGIQKFNSGKK